MTSTDDPCVNVVSQQSLDSISMTNGAEEWVQLRTAMNHIISIMQGWIPSLRHELFMDKRERS